MYERQRTYRFAAVGIGRAVLADCRHVVSQGMELIGLKVKYLCTLHIIRSTIQLNHLLLLLLALLGTFWLCRLLYVASATNLNLMTKLTGIVR
jgi:hypothetical protein